jgi:GcrA cell cycle regulator
MSDFVWDAKATGVLLKMHREGCSAAQIAKALRNKVTRNAVLGKVHRLRGSGQLNPAIKTAAGLSESNARATSVAKAKSRQIARQHKPSTGFGSAAVPSVVVPPRPISVTEYDTIDPKTPGLLRMMELRRHHCRWPLNSALGGEYYFCGDQKVVGRPYCERHAAIAYDVRHKSRGGK